MEEAVPESDRTRGPSAGRGSCRGGDPRPRRSRGASATPPGSADPPEEPAVDGEAPAAAAAEELSPRSRSGSCRGT